MARDKALQTNIDGSDLVAYPNKRIRNNDGSGNGTPVDEYNYGDIHELMAKFMRDSKLPYNGLPDNEQNGHQLYEAFLNVAGKNALVKNLSLFNATTISIPIKIDVLKADETLLFKSSFDSLPTYVNIKGTDGVTKALNIAGVFKVNQLVRLINTPTQIILLGLYDTQNAPDLIARLTTLENSIQPMIDKLAVFQAGGGMVLWNKPLALIPFGWHEVVNWRGRLPIGLDLTDSDFDVIGKIGGSKTKALTAANNGPHNHDWKYGVENDDNGSGGSAAEFTKIPGFIPSNDPSNPIGTSGTGTPFNVMNPFRTVLFIEYTGA